MFFFTRTKRQKMSYIIIDRTNKDSDRFLIDRGYNTSTWWTTDLSQAMYFQKRDSAEFQLDKFKSNRSNLYISSVDAYRINIVQRRLILLEKKLEDVQQKLNTLMTAKDSPSKTHYPDNM